MLLQSSSELLKNDRVLLSYMDSNVAFEDEMGVRKAN